MVWSVAFFCAETWTLMKEDIRRIEAFEIWGWRRMEKICWTEKITNEEVLRREGKARTMIAMIVRSTKHWIGHVMRREGLLREGRMEGKRGLGRPLIGMINDLLEKESYADIKRRAEDQMRWKVWTPKTHVAEH